MLRYKVYKFKSNGNQKANGKFYGRVTHNVMEFDEFVHFLSVHNCVFSEGTIHGVLIEMLNSLRELLLDGKAVRLGDLGIFSIGAATKGEEKAEDFDAENFKGVRLNLHLGRRFRAKKLLADARFREADGYTAAPRKKNKGGSTNKPSGGENEHP